MTMFFPPVVSTEMTTYVKVVGFAAAVMGLILLLLSLSVDTIVAVNEDGDTVQVACAVNCEYVCRI